MKAALFVTCLADLFYPEVGQSVVEVLERLGVEVSFPLRQTCCGQVSYNSGYQQDSIRAAKHFVEVFEAEVEGGADVVIPSGSCAAMIRIHYPELLEGEPEWHRRLLNLRAHVFEFSEYVANKVGVERLRQLSPALAAKAAYHRSCHMSRQLGVAEEPLKVLSCIDGLELVPFFQEDACCGFGGTFAVKMPQISLAMGEEKIRHLKDSGAELFLTSDMGCCMHLGGQASRLGVNLPFKHVAQVLVEGVQAK